MDANVACSCYGEKPFLHARKYIVLQYAELHLSFADRFLIHESAQAKSVDVEEHLQIRMGLRVMSTEEFQRQLLIGNPPQSHIFDILTSATVTLRSESVD